MATLDAPMLVVDEDRQRQFPIVARPSQPAARETEAPTDVDDKFMTVTEASLQLGISQTSVRRRFERGALAGYREDNEYIKIARASVDEALRQRRHNQALALTSFGGRPTEDEQLTKS